MATARFHLIFYAPLFALESCKTAIFAAGAGRYPGSGKYTECCWTVVGTGQFRPGDTASPHLGKPGALETVEEARVETLCVGEDVTRRAVKALKLWVMSNFSYLPTYEYLQSLLLLLQRVLRFKRVVWLTVNLQGASL